MSGNKISNLELLESLSETAESPSVPYTEPVPRELSVARKKTKLEPVDAVPSVRETPGGAVVGVTQRLRPEPTPQEVEINRQRILEAALLGSALPLGMAPAAGMALRGAAPAIARQAVPMAERAAIGIAESMVPKTAMEAFRMTAGGGAAGASAELARQLAEQQGVGQLGQFGAELAGGMAPSAVVGPISSGVRAYSSKIADSLEKATRLLPYRQQRAAEDAALRIMQAQRVPEAELTNRMISEFRALGMTDDAAQNLSNVIKAERRKIAETAGVREEKMAGRLAGEQQRAQAAVTATEGSLGVPLSKDAFANIVQTKARENLGQVRERTFVDAIKGLKDPAFADAVAREAKGDFVSTFAGSKAQFNELESEINRVLSSIPEPLRSSYKKQVEGVLGSSRPLTDAEVRAATLRSSVTGEPIPQSVRDPVSLSQLEAMRRYIGEAAKSGREVSGFEAFSALNNREIKDALTKAMNAYDTRIGDYLARYRAGKVEEIPFTFGRAAALTESVPFARDIPKYSADQVIGKFLDGRASGARDLKAVYQNDAELEKQLAGYYRYQFGEKNSKQIRSALERDKEFLNEFPNLKKNLEAVAYSKELLEQAAKRSETMAGKTKFTEADVMEKLRKERFAANRDVESQFANLLNSGKWNEIGAFARRVSGQPGGSEAIKNSTFNYISSLRPEQAAEFWANNGSKLVDAKIISSAHAGDVRRIVDDLNSDLAKRAVTLTSLKAGEAAQIKKGALSLGLLTLPVTWPLATAFPVVAAGTGGYMGGMAKRGFGLTEYKQSIEVALQKLAQDPEYARLLASKPTLSAVEKIDQGLRAATGGRIGLPGPPDRVYQAIINPVVGVAGAEAAGVQQSLRDVLNRPYAGQIPVEIMEGYSAAP